MKNLPAQVNKYCFLLIGMFLFNSSHGQVIEIKKLQHQLTKTKDSIQYVNILNRIGLLIHMKSPDSSFYYGIKAKSIANRLQYVKGDADALTNIAIGLTLKGLYNESLSYYSKAIAEYKKISDERDITQLLMNTAITYNFQGDRVKYIEFLKRSVKSAARIYPDSIVAMLYANYADSRWLSADSSRYYLQKAENIAFRYKDERTLQYVQQIKAHKLLTSGKPDEALPYIKKSMAMSNSKWEYYQMESLNLSADYFVSKNNIDSAIRCYNSIYKIATANGYLYWQTIVLRLMLHCYELNHDTEQQIRINKLLVNALELKNKNTNKFIADYILYNATQDELEHVALINTINKKKISWLVFFSIIGIMLTALLFHLYIRSRKNSRILSLLNKRIEKQNKKLQQTDEFKGRLISMLAHDFRAPLASTIAMVRLLKESDDMEKQELLHLYDYMEADIHNILLTFDNMLQWMKKQLSGYTYKPQVLNAYNMMNEASSMFADIIEAKKIKLRNQVPEDLTFLCDKEIIQFINRNLIHNALKFSPNNATITINVIVINNEMVFSVRDEGKGMTTQQTSDLFALSDQMDADIMEKGAGIALTICKEFIQKVNGRIWAQSKENEGSVFFYALPL